MGEFDRIGRAARCSCSLLVKPRGEVQRAPRRPGHDWSTRGVRRRPTSRSAAGACGICALWKIYTQPVCCTDS
eukprot:3460264-Prymnesium_polylepis.1